MNSSLPFLLGIAASLSTYAGGFLALRLIRKLDLLLGLTAGLMIGLALLDLLPEAIEAGAGHHGALLLMGALVSGLGFYLLLHRLPAGPAFSRAGLILHSLMDGLGIGLAFQFSSASGWLVAAAVLAHDMADGVNMVGLSVSPHKTSYTHRWLAVNAAAPIAGVALGQAIHIDPGQFSLMLALFAGGFLYIGAGELLPRSRAASPGLRSGFASVLGLCLMGAIVHLAS